MKQCPNCLGMNLYSDEERTCPHCDATLVPYVARSERRSRHSAYAGEEPVRPQQDAGHRQSAGEPAFERQGIGGVDYRGIVNSISPSSRFMRNSLKWANSFFRGLPYQLGNPVYETVIRIEEIQSGRMAERMRNLTYYGEANELSIGDDVAVSTINRQGRTIIRRLWINDTESPLHPRGQISATTVQILTLSALFCILLLLSGIVSFFTSGGLWTLIGAITGGIVSIAMKLLVMTAPLLGLVFIYWILFRKK